MILDEIRKWISAVVMATEQGSRAVTSGVNQAAFAGQSIRSLSENVMASVQASSVIETSAEQQFVGVDQISSSMGEIQQAVNQNVTGLQQLQSAVIKLEDLGGTLEELVKRFTG